MQWCNIVKNNVKLKYELVGYMLEQPQAPFNASFKNYPDVASMLIIISRVLWCALGTLNLLRAQTHEPDLCIVHDFLLLKLCQSVLEVL